VFGISGQTKLLAHHFFGRFLYNDLLSPNGESQANVAFVLAGLAVSSVWMVGLLFFTYSSPFIPPSERLLMALSHKYQFIAISMVLMALVTTLQWDALGLDARDLSNLGPLPIPGNRLLTAKVLALLALFSAFTVALNLVPSLGFPIAWFSLVPIGLPRVAWLMFVHAVVTTAAAAFGFAVVLALRGLLLVAAGPRMFRSLSTLAQFVLVLGLVTLFFLIPAGGSSVSRGLERNERATVFSPATWFLGAYERVTAPGLLGDEGMLTHTKSALWTRTRRRVPTERIDRIVGRTEDEARERYDAVFPALSRLGGLAAPAFAGATGLGILLYFAGYARSAGRLREAAVANTRRGAHVRRAARRIAEAIVVRQPVTRAAFFFTLHALTRSGKHRLYVAGYMALGLAWVFVINSSGLERAGVLPSLNTLAAQLTLLFFGLAGFRAVMDIPAELRSNWVFQATWVGDLRHYLAGVRRAAIIAVVVPLLLVLFPLHTALWGLRLALEHAAVGAVVAMILLETMMVGYRKLPFTCSYAAKGSFKFLWPAYLAAFLVSTFGVASLERGALEDSGRTLTLLTWLFVALVILRVLRSWRARQQAEIVFEDLPEPPTLRLGLSR